MDKQPEQFISYAQNYEDVMLWRALKHVQHGFYVDVGASDPTELSVTRAFYERGWHGINIEPMAQYLQRLSKERVHDINLPVAVGAEEGEISFFEVPDTGISSVISEAILNNPSLGGKQVIEKKIPITTLNNIFLKYILGEIHFLKIDVEGYEKSVLEGLDLKRWRPWILVIEATRPGSQELNYESWENIVSSEGYAFVYFDGINRYYIASEHSDLAESFKLPPNLFDFFLSYDQVKANQEIEQLKHALSDKTSSTLFLEKEKDWIRSELDRTWSEKESVNAKLSSWERKYDQLNKELTAHAEQLRNKIDETQKELNRTHFDLDNTKIELDKTHSDLNKTKKELNKTNSDLDKTNSDLDKTMHDLITAQEELEQTRNKVAYFQMQYVNLLNSRSYKITKPLRLFYTIVAAFRRRSAEQIKPQNQFAEPEFEKVDLATAQENVRQDFDADKQYFLSLFKREIGKLSKRDRE